MSSETLERQQQQSIDLRDFLNGAGQGRRDGGRRWSGHHQQGHCDGGHGQSGHHSHPEQGHCDGGHGQTGHHQQGHRDGRRDWSGHHSRPEQGHCDGGHGQSGHHQQGHCDGRRHWSGHHSRPEQGHCDGGHGQTGHHQQGHCDGGHGQSGHHQQGHCDGRRHWSGHHSRPEQGQCDGGHGQTGHHQQGPRYGDRDWSGHHSRPEQGQCDGRRHWSGPHSHPEHGQRDGGHRRSGHHSRPKQRQRDEYTPPHVLNQLLSEIHQGLLQGNVSLEKLVQSEQNLMLQSDMQRFLQESGACLYDAFRRIGLVQTPDGSWSAPESLSLLSSFPEFFASVVGSFSNSIFHFLNATLFQHLVKVDGVLTPRYAFETADRRTVSAVGALFYSPTHGFLMQSVPDKNGEIRLTDFGGKVDSKDETFINSLCREVAEETNSVFPPEYDFLGNCLKYLYLNDSKYLLLICQAPPEFESIDLSQFGTSEDGSSINRTVVWVSVEDFLRAQNLHPRLSSQVKDMVHQLFLQ